MKLSEKDMDILKVALKQTGMTASAYIRELIRTGRRRYTEKALAGNAV